MRTIWPNNIKIPIQVDDEDYEHLKQFKWNIGAQGYPVRSLRLAPNKWTKVYMHRDLLQVDKGFEVEHQNQNKLDNRRSNLRSATRSQNMANVRRKQKAGALSQYKGVSRLNRPNLKRQWLAYIRKDYKTIYLGYYDDEREAGHVYNQVAEQLFGEFASLNDID